MISSGVVVKESKLQLANGQKKLYRAPKTLLGASKNMKCKRLIRGIGVSKKVVYKSLRGGAK